MNVNTPIKHTQAESELLDRFEQVKAVGLSGSVAVVALREAAAGQLQSKGLPHRRVEEYKYTDLRAFMRTAAPLAEKATQEEVRTVLDATAGDFDELDRYRIVIANGRYQAALSDGDALAREGVFVSCLNDNLGTDEGGHLLHAPRTAAQDGILALNTAFVQGGAVISVKPGAQVSKPVELVQVAASVGAQAVRNSISVAHGASLRLLETFAGSTGAGEINTVFDYEIADEASLAVTRLATSQTDAAIFLTTIARIGAQAEFKCLGFLAGPSFVRNQQFVSFAGEHSTGKMYGVSMARGQDLADQTLIVDHAVPHCSSREFFKAVLDDQARGVYQGRINVAQHAQKTDGEMMTQALLLDDGAEMANKPELEIFADDVLCAHGATSGQIDEELLFYLRARGIPEREARTLLILAFLSEAIEEFGEDDVTESLEQRVRDWLAHQ